MADPEDYIEIADFSPGIWSDIHASDRSSNPPEMGDGLRGFLPVNGAATIENTWQCHADKTGALVPLLTIMPPGYAYQSEGGIPDQRYGPQYRPPERPGAYVLDAELSPLRFFGGGNFGKNAFNWSLHILWGFYYDTAGDGENNGYRAYILGREYRGAAWWQPKLDFMLCRGMWTVSNREFTLLPAGSLCVAHVDLNARRSVIASKGVRFDLTNVSSVVVALGSVRHVANPEQDYWTHPDSNPLSGFSVEQSWLTKVPDPPGGGSTSYRPSNFAQVVNDWVPASLGCSIGMSWAGNEFNPKGGTKPTDEWAWHHKDEAGLSDDPNVLVTNVPIKPTLMIAHQGRIVFVDELGIGPSVSEEFDPNAQGSNVVYYTRDVLWYSDWGLPIGEVWTSTYYVPNTKAMTSYKPLLVAEDTPARIEVIGVTTADELFVVKARGGGAVIRGDLDNPTIRRLPHIESTFGVSSKGVATPLGFVYGSRTGIHVFDGGDTTRKLSRQLDGFFWNPYDPAVEGEDPVYGSYGRFAYWNDCVYVPNNYVYDTTTDSWWRIGGEEYWRTILPNSLNDWHPYNCYLVTPNGELYLIPYKHTADATHPAPVYHRCVQGHLSSVYSWQSPPLVETRGRRVSVQEVRMLVTADAQSTIKVTLTGRDETGAQVAAPEITLTTAAAREPQILRADVTPNFVAEYVQVRIVANAGSGRRAPKIHNLRLGIKSRQRTPRHGV